MPHRMTCRLPSSADEAEEAPVPDGATDSDKARDYSNLPAPLAAMCDGQMADVFADGRRRGRSTKSPQRDPRIERVTTFHRTVREQLLGQHDRADDQDKKIRQLTGRLIELTGRLRDVEQSLQTMGARLGTMRVALRHMQLKGRERQSREMEEDAVGRPEPLRDEKREGEEEEIDAFGQKSEKTDEERGQ